MHGYSPVAKKERSVRREPEHEQIAPVADELSVTVVELVVERSDEHGLTARETPVSRPDLVEGTTQPRRWRRSRRPPRRHRPNRHYTPGTAARAPPTQAVSSHGV